MAWSIEVTGIHSVDTGGIPGGEGFHQGADSNPVNTPFKVSVTGAAKFLAQVKVAGAATALIWDKDDAITRGDSLSKSKGARDAGAGARARRSDKIEHADESRDLGLQKNKGNFQARKIVGNGATASAVPPTGRPAKAPTAAPENVAGALKAAGPTPRRALSKIVPSPKAPSPDAITGKLALKDAAKARQKLDRLHGKAGAKHPVASLVGLACRARDAPSRPRL